MTKKSKVALIICAASIIIGTAATVYFAKKGSLSSQASTNSIQWRSNGYGSAGAIDVLTIDQKDPNNVYIGCDVAGIFRSIDGGTTWQFANTGLSGYYIAGLKVDPISNNIVYAYTNDGFFKSDNYAQTWTRISNIVIPSMANRDGDSGTQAINLGLNNGQLDFYVFTTTPGQEGIYRSSDGITWSKTSNPIYKDSTEDKVFRSIAVDPNNRSHVVIGTSKGLYDSINAGQSWKYYPTVTKAISTLSPDSRYDFRFVGFNKKNSDLIYAMNYSGEIYRSTKISSGYTFNQIGNDTNNSPLYNTKGQGSAKAAYVDTNPSDPNEDTIYITHNSTYPTPTADRPFSWTYNTKTNSWQIIANYDGPNKNITYPSDWFTRNFYYNKQMTGTRSIDIDLSKPYDSRKLIINAGRIALGQKTNGAWQWDYRVKGIENYEAYDVKYDPNNPDIIYAMDADSDFIKSTDGGKTWLRKDTGMSPYTTNCVDTTTTNCMSQGDAFYLEIVPNADKTKPSTLIAAVNHWAPNNPTPNQYGITNAGGRIFISTDAGETWVDKSKGLPPMFKFDEKRSHIQKIVYSKTDNLIFLTMKRTPINAQECQDVKGHVCTDGTVTSTNNELNYNIYPTMYMSKDFGESWQPITMTGLPEGAYANEGGMAYNDNTHELFFGVYNYYNVSDLSKKGIYKINPLTSDGWTLVNNFGAAINTNRPIYDLVIKDNNIFATVKYWSTTTGSKLWISNDNGVTWHAGNGGTPFNNTNAWISIDPKNVNHIFITTNNWWSKANLGVFESYDGGSTFTQQNSGLDHTDVYRIAFNPQDSSKMILSAAGGGGLFFSYDPNASKPEPSTPTLTISQPTNTSTVKDTVTIESVSNVMVSSVEYYLDAIADTSLIGSSVPSPFVVDWDSTKTVNGTHKILAQSKDANGDLLASSNIDITVNNSTSDTTAPVVSITAPSDNSTVIRNTTVSITADASDDTGITKVEFYINNSLVTTTTSDTPTYKWKVPSAKNKKYTIKAIAYDAANNKTTSSIIHVTSK